MASITLSRLKLDLDSVLKQEDMVMKKPYQTTSESLVDMLKEIRDKVIGSKWMKTEFVAEIHKLVRLFTIYLQAVDGDSHSFGASEAWEQILVYLVVLFGSFAFGIERVQHELRLYHDEILNGLVSIIQSREICSRRLSLHASNSLRALIFEQVIQSDAVASRFDLAVCESLLLSPEASLACLGSEIIKGSSLQGSSSAFIGKITTVQNAVDILAQLLPRVHNSLKRKRADYDIVDEFLVDPNMDLNASLFQGLISICLSGSDAFRKELRNLPEMSQLLSIRRTLDSRNHLFVCKLFSACMRSNSFSSALFSDILLGNLTEQRLVYFLRHLVEGNNDDPMIDSTLCSEQDLSNIVTELISIGNSESAIEIKREALLLVAVLTSSSIALQRSIGGVFAMDTSLTGINLEDIDYADMLVLVSLCSQLPENRRLFSHPMIRRHIFRTTSGFSGKMDADGNLLLAATCGFLRVMSRGRSNAPFSLLVPFDSSEPTMPLAFPDRDLAIDESILLFSVNFLNRSQKHETMMNVGMRLDVAVFLANVSMLSKRAAQCIMNRLSASTISDVLRADYLENSGPLLLIKKSYRLSLLKLVANLLAENRTEDLNTAKPQLITWNELLPLLKQDDKELRDLCVILLSNIVADFSKRSINGNVELEILKQLEEFSFSSELSLESEEALLLCLLNLSNKSEAVKDSMVVSSRLLNRTLNSLQGQVRRGNVQRKTWCVEILYNICMSDVQDSPSQDFSSVRNLRHPLELPVDISETQLNGTESALMRLIRRSISNRTRPIDRSSDRDDFSRTSTMESIESASATTAVTTDSSRLNRIRILEDAGVASILGEIELNHIQVSDSSFVETVKQILQHFKNN